ncbi:hypothetical protein [Gordonia sp. (in: high G+C Gram-positive bacteria)]|uniref:hypothetical protein n=1 Tax=Gordonia sp. (in: high G+C Gram-positive bacteria) TaxID=84139 RepID=UPI0033421A3D
MSALAMAKAAGLRAAWAERRFEIAAAEYVRVHLGTSIRPAEHEKQTLHALKADVYESRAVVRELAGAA